MIDIDNIFSIVTSPQVTEQQLQTCLQQVNTALTETSVSLKWIEDNLANSQVVPAEIKDKVDELINCKDDTKSKQTALEIINELNVSNNSYIAEFNALLQDPNNGITQTEVNHLNNILSTLSSNPTTQNLASLLETINVATQQEAQVLAVHQNNLNMLMQNAGDVIAEDVKSEIQNAEGKNKLEVYSGIVDILEQQINTSIQAFKDYQEQMKTE